MKNRIELLKERYAAMKASREEETEIVKDVFENLEDVVEELPVTRGIVEGLGNGNRRYVPFILL